MTGIYQIRNAINGRRYIGSTVGFHKRQNEHLRLLKTNRHHSALLQKEWNEYSETDFVFEIIEKCERFELIVKEQQYLDKQNPEYNICKIAGLGSRLGIKHTEETRRKMASKRIGRKPSLGKHWHLTDETRKRISAYTTGKSNPMFGRKQSEETKQKISDSLRKRNKI